MKKIMIITAMIFLFAAGSNTKADVYRSMTGVTFNYFYTSLAPYGDWIELEPGMIVWKPVYTGRNWSPYIEGEWVYTAYGWHWNSYEPFGWAVYHYGRWFFDDYYGWVWMPGYEWAPAWVEWRYSDAYVGWAPLPPYAEYLPGSGIRFTIEWHFPINHWHFVSFNYFGHRNVRYYIEKPSYNNVIYPKTKYRTNYYERNGRIVNNGIERTMVEKRSGVKVVTRDVNVTNNRNSVTRGNSSDSRSVTVFRPDENEVRSSENLRSVSVVRGNGKSSLQGSKVADRNRSNVKADVVRNAESRSEAETDRNTTYRKNNTGKEQKATGRSEATRSNNERKSNTTRGTSTRKESTQSGRSSNATKSNGSSKEKTSGTRSNGTSTSRSKSNTNAPAAYKNEKSKTSSRSETPTVRKGSMSNTSRSKATAGSSSSSRNSGSGTTRENKSRSNSSNSSNSRSR